MDCWERVSLLPRDTQLLREVTIKSLLNCLALPVHLLNQFTMLPMVCGNILRLPCPISAGLESQMNNSDKNNSHFRRWLILSIVLMLIHNISRRFEWLLDVNAYAIVSSL